MEAFMNHLHIEEQGSDFSSAMIWNKFIADICTLDIGKLSASQRPAVLSFWYDAEMNSGGHSSWFDVYPNISNIELINTLNEVKAKQYAANFQNAVENGISDDYEETDNTFYNLSPSLTDLIEKYVRAHEKEIFRA
jgi:hypothetical protein